MISDSKTILQTLPKFAPARAPITEADTRNLGVHVISEISQENLSIDQKMMNSTERDFNLSKLSSEAAGRKDSESNGRKVSDFLITEVPGGN